MFFGTGLAEAYGSVFLALIAIVMATFVAMPFHEFAHAWAARSEGDFTSVAHKRYTLAPHAHFDFLGFVFLVLFRFGWAKPVPIDSRNFRNGRKSQFKVAIAGILMNLFLGTFFLFMYMFLFRFFPNVYRIKFYGQLLYNFLTISVSFNYMLAFFNLLPIYPLDGYRIIDSFCKYENGFLRFMKTYSLIIYLVFAFSDLYYYYYLYTGGLLVEGFTKLFTLILGFWYGRDYTRKRTRGY